MGGCCSSADDKYAAPSQQPRAAQNGGVKPPPAPKAKANTPGAPPDFGLAQTHEIIKILGKGGEGETWLAREKATGHEVAIKLIRRPIPKPAIAVIKREIKIQADLGQGHLNIVSADEVILSKTHLGLVMEYVPGGNMVNYVTKKRETKHERGGLCLTEDEAHYFFLQLLSAVEYCHRNHVAHRDLKLDNTLLDSHSPPWLKVCDFGFAKHWQANSNMDTMRIGTPEYMGPELISSRGLEDKWGGEWRVQLLAGVGHPPTDPLVQARCWTGYDGKKVDVWAAGVLLFVMLVGVFPFETQDDNFNNTAGLYDIWLQQIKTSWRDTPSNSNAVAKLSPEVKDLLDKMFEVKQDVRVDVAGIKSHPWFRRPLQPHFAASLEQLRQQQLLVDEQVKAFAGHQQERDRMLEAMLDKAVTPALPSEQLSRLSLSKLGKSTAAGAGDKGGSSTLAALKEEE
ncbi:hypothetical protein QJQ45_028510 [Haematococcus lacustris]|nr:hypothetical protein QJQ45_028510 [Haematococcus lacustris]